MRAIYRFTREENGLEMHRYWSSACPQCPMKTQCTTGDNRRIARWEHESVLEAMQRRLNLQPEAMTLRRCTVEHVFGTLHQQAISTVGSKDVMSYGRCRFVGAFMSMWNASPNEGATSSSESPLKE